MTSATRSQRLRDDFPFEVGGGAGKLVRAGRSARSPPAGSAERNILFSWSLSPFAGDCVIAHFDHLHMIAHRALGKRWVKSVKDECLSKIILFGERSLRRALSEYVEHYHAERNHQGKSNVLLFRRVTQTRREEPVQCRERLGGLLRYYHQEAA